METHDHSSASGVYRRRFGSQIVSMVSSYVVNVCPLQFIGMALSILVDPYLQSFIGTWGPGGTVYQLPVRVWVVASAHKQYLLFYGFRFVCSFNMDENFFLLLTPKFGAESTERWIKLLRKIYSPSINRALIWKVCALPAKCSPSSIKVAWSNTTVQPVMKLEATQWSARGLQMISYLYSFETTVTLFRIGFTLL